MAAPIKLSFPATRGYWEIPVLHEDDHVLALDKPAGLQTSPSPREPELPSLMQLLHAGIRDRKPWAHDRELGYLANAHGLDAEASGVLVLARSKPVLASLTDQFSAERSEKIFSVLTQGEATEAPFSVTLPMARHPKFPERMRVDTTHGKKSTTQVSLIESFRGYSFLKCSVSTDRNHQVRVHLQRRRLPAVGDPLYGGRPLLLSELKPGYRFKPEATEKPLIGRAAVHLGEVNITHPVTEAKLQITSPLPKDFQVALKYLRRFASTTPPIESDFQDDFDDLPM